MKTKLLALLALALVGFAQAETYTASISGTTFEHAWSLPLELSANDTLVVSVNGNSDQSAVDWTGITGTGTIKFQGSGIVTLPNADYRFAETLAVASDVSLKLDQSWRTTNGGYTITQFKTCDFRGSAALSRYTERSRCHLWTTQSTVTEWSGVLEKSYEYNGTQYGVYLWVASDSASPSREKALIISGAQTSNQTLNIESSGCVILKGQWKGTINNNGLLVIAPGVDRSQFTVNGSGTTELQQASEVIVIAPPDLKATWEEEFAPAYAEIHPGYTCSVVSTADIYKTYPYVATNTNGAPRNPAESIHAFIKNANLKDGNQYFILGGPWVDIDDIATNKVMKLATGETLSLANTVPGVIISPDARYPSPTDMYYACFDSANTYAWDPDGDEKYLDTNTWQNCSIAADVVVSRIPLVTWEGWVNDDGRTYSQRELLAAYVNKLRRASSTEFTGNNRYGIYGTEVDRKAQQLGGESEEWTVRTETAFYDNGYNMFDPARGSDDFHLVEGICHRRAREQIATARPIDDVNGFYELSLNKKHASRNEAREAWKSQDYAFRFYYSHGSRNGLLAGTNECYLMSDYAQKDCGLTLFDDCAGPCSTGALEFENDIYQINYAMGCVMSPFGGSVASINNTRYGIYGANYWKSFSPNDSWRFANGYLVGFVVRNETVGEAWRQNAIECSKIQIRDNHWGAIDYWMLAEEMLQGDPLVRLPAVEDGLAYADGITYKGIEGKKDVVVEMNLSASATEIKSDAKFKVMNGLKTAASSLTITTGVGGIGGEGVTFAGEKGTLTLAGNEPFYVAGVENGSKVIVTGKGATLDFDSFDISALEIGEGADVTIRSNERGALAKIGNALTIPANAIVRLATWDAFGDTKGTITVGADAKLIIEANPSYHDGNNRGEALNADIVFEKGVDAFDVAISDWADFTGDKDPRVTYTEISPYADELYYLNSATEWTASVRGGVTDGSGGSGLIGTNTLVRFMSSYGVVYIHDDVRCSHISVENSANLQIGYWNNTWTIPSNWTVDIADGSSLTIERWGNGNRGAVVFGSNITLNGGTMTFGADVTSATCGNISGTATIALPGGVTLTSTGTIDNPIVVPKGYELSTTKGDSSTIYRAIQTRTIYWDSSTSKEWSSKAGMPPFVDEGGNRVSYQFGDTVVVRKTADNELWLGSVAEGVPFVIDGCAVQIENESKGVAGFSGSDVSVVNGGSIAYRSRWNGVKLKDSSIHLEKGTSFGPYSQWTCVVDIEGIVTFDGERTVSFASEGAKLVTASSELIVPVDAEPIKVTSGIDNHLVLSESDGERRVYRLIEQSAAVTIPEGMTAELSDSALFSGTVVGAGRLIVTDSPSATLKASLKAETWTGTFCFKGWTSATGDMYAFDPSNYANEKSGVELWDSSCFFPSKANVTIPVTISGTVHFTDGYSSMTNTLAVLKGTGNLVCVHACTMTYNVTDASEFYGEVKYQTGTGITINLPASSPSVLKKNGYLSYTIDSNGVIQDLAVTEQARPTIGAFTLGETTAVTIAAPIVGLTYTLKSAATLDASDWTVDDWTKAETSDPLALEAEPSESAARFYRVVVSF